MLYKLTVLHLPIRQRHFPSSLLGNRSTLQHVHLERPQQAQQKTMPQLSNISSLCLDYLSDRFSLISLPPWLFHPGLLWLFSALLLCGLLLFGKDAKCSVRIILFVSVATDRMLTISTSYSKLYVTIFPPEYLTNYQPGLWAWQKGKVGANHTQGPRKYFKTSRDLQKSMLRWISYPIKKLVFKT